jgi:hypothetical protein
MTTKPPTPQAISALLRKAGFTRSNYGAKGVMWNEASTGYSVWRTFHANDPDQPYIAVQHHIREDGWEPDWPARKKEMRSRLEEYAAALRAAGYAALVRDRGSEPPWLTIMTVVSAQEDTP